MGHDHPHHRPGGCPSRRQFLRRSLAGAAGLAGFAGLPVPLLRRLRADDPVPSIPKDLLAVPDRSAKAPTAPVGIVRCREYEPAALEKALRELLDLTGGLEKLVSGKTVTVKLNTTGNGKQKMCGLPSERTYQVHPAMVEALCALFIRSGARRIVLVESFYENRAPEEILARQGWKIDRIQSAAEHRVLFADTKNKGDFADYAVLKVPHGGYVFPAYHLSRHYVDTDVLVSLAKLKNHITAGITGAVKNLFGIAPTSLYGEDAPNEKSTSNRGAVFHFGTKGPPAGVAAERYADTPRGDTAATFYRVPRVTADLFSLRPVDLAIVDGVESVFGGEGPWCPPPHRAMKPGVIIAGRNAVTTDAVGVGVMGYDPQAAFAEHPFPGENHLNLLARAGVGSNDLARIEVRGLTLVDALHEYEPQQAKAGWVRRNLIRKG